MVKANRRSHDVRAMARLVALMGRIAGDADTDAVLALLLDLARLADTLAALREAQQRHHQAETALKTAVMLRAAASATGRLTPAAAVPAPDLSGVAPGPAAAWTPDPTPQQPSTRDSSRRPRRG